MSWLNKKSEGDKDHFAFEDEPSGASEASRPTDSPPQPKPEAKPAPQPAQNQNQQSAPQQTLQPVMRRRVFQETEKEKEEHKPGIHHKLRHSWVGRHWKTIAILAFIFCLGFFARAYYGVGPATESGFLLSGGSDSYYYNQAIDVGTDTGHQLFWDSMLNYPISTRNPRCPLFNWFVTLGGIPLAPFFDGGVMVSTMYVFLFSTAFWGALTIFPIYFLGKEAFGKKAGYIAAFLLAVMPGHIQRSVLSNADHDSMALFFIVTAFYFFLRALKLLEQREYVTSWKSSASVWGGLKEMIRVNKTSLLYSMLAGLSIAGIALTWQGYAYAVVIMTIYFLVQIIINKFRNTDSLATLAVYFVTVGVGLLIAFPFYYQSINIPGWFDMPAIMCLGVSAFALIIILTRKYSWLLVYSSIIGIGLLALLILYFVGNTFFDTLMNTIASGAGYFISNKQYQTIAEAQAPPFSNLALSFGVFTFWLSFVGVAWAAIQLPKKIKADFVFILIWMVTSIYMAVTAARFMFNAAPAFAITAGWVIAIILDKLSIRKFSDHITRATPPKVSRGFSLGLAGATALIIIVAIGVSSVPELAPAVFVIGITAIVGALMMNLIAESNPKKSFYLFVVLVPMGGAFFYLFSSLVKDWTLTLSTHLFLLFIMLFIYFVMYLIVRKIKVSFIVGVLFLAFCVVTPNVWGGLDAGIPYETKRLYDREIYDVMPNFMHPDDYDMENGTNYYLGSFGYSLPLNSRYWPAAFDWLKTQDANIYPPSDRPAFLSWWDYGFEIIHESQHPTVADNFLSGHQLAGNFIMAQSEEDGIGLLITRLLEGNRMGSAENRIIYGAEVGLTDGVKTILQDYGLNVALIEDIFTNPSNYIDEIKEHPEIYGPRDVIIQPENAMYLSIRGHITQTLDLEQVVNLYHDIREETGKVIRYFAIDSRMFPFTADNTGIFYAPAKLSDHRINDVGNQPYDFWEIKAVDEFGGEYSLDDIPDDVTLNKDEPYKIDYKDMFFNSMLYKTYVGYSGKDIGQTIDAGVPGLSGDLASSPIMPGWNMSHFKLVHRTAYWNPYSGEEVAEHTDAWQAMNYPDAKALQQNGTGVSDLSDRSSLYQGVMMLKYYDGAIVSGKAMLEDGTPVKGAIITVTDDFAIPHQMVYTSSDGSYSVLAPFGNVTITTSAGAINPSTLMAAELNITNIFVEDYQAMRENEDRNNDGKPDYLINLNPVIPSGGLYGTVFLDEDSNEAMSTAEKTIPNAQLVLKNSNLEMSHTVYSDEYGFYFLEKGSPGDYSVDVYLSGSLMGTFTATVQSSTNSTKDIGIKPTTLTGIVRFDNGTTAADSIVKAWVPGLEQEEISTTTNSSGGYSLSTYLLTNYSILATYGYYSSPLIRYQVQKDINNTLDLTIYESYNITGTVQLSDGTPIPNTIVRFSSYIDYTATTDINGSYSIALAEATYDVSSDYTKSSRSYAFISQLEATSDQNLNITLESAVKLFGKVTRGNTNLPANNVEVEFESMSAGAWAFSYTNNQGVFMITLPQGQYSIQISTTLENMDWTYYSLNNFIAGVAEINITLSESQLVQGSIYWDRNGDQIMQSNEALQGALARFVDTAGNTYIARTNQNGTYYATLRPGTNYQTFISRPGFNEINIGTLNVEDFGAGLSKAIEPVPVSVEGTIYDYNGLPLENQTVNIQFISGSEGSSDVTVQVRRDGTYTADLIPGIYEVTFSADLSGDGDHVLQIKDPLQLETGYYTGTPFKIDMLAMERMEVQVSLMSPQPLTSNLTFRDGPEYKEFVCENGSGSFFVMPGDYTVIAYSVVNETVWVGMINATVSLEERSIAFTMVEGKSINGILTFESSKINDREIIFRDTSTNGAIITRSDENAEYTTYLIPGREYMVQVDFTAFEFNNGVRYAYHYFVNESFSVSTWTSSVHPISLSREDFHTELSGQVSQNGSPAPFAKVEFTSPANDVETTTDEIGKYSVTLMPGNYSVYVHNMNNHMVYLGEIELELEETGELNLELTQGFKVYGNTYYNLNMHETTDLKFTSEQGTVKITTDTDGFYQLWLPAGNYTITGNASPEESFMGVAYTLDLNVEINADKHLNLPMSLVESTSLTLTWNEIYQKKTIYSAESVTYTVEVTNTGNVVDTYDFTITGYDSGWSATVSPNKITLPPGTGNTGTLAVTIETPELAMMVHGALTLSGVSSKNPETKNTVVISVGIWQQFDFAIENTDGVNPIFDHGEITTSFDVKNMGNGGDKYTVYIANQDTLALSGWSAEFASVPAGDLAMNNTLLINLTIEPRSAHTIKLVLKPISDTPGRMAEILVAGYSQIGPAYSSKYIVIRYPELKAHTYNETVIGEGVFMQPSGSQMINASIMGATVATALVLFYVARKKRWIR